MAANNMRRRTTRKKPYTFWVEYEQTTRPVNAGVVTRPNWSSTTLRTTRRPSQIGGIANVANATASSTSTVKTTTLAPLSTPTHVQLQTVAPLVAPVEPERPLLPAAGSDPPGNRLSTSAATSSTPAGATQTQLPVTEADPLPPLPGTNATIIVPLMPEGQPITVPLHPGGTEDILGPQENGHPNGEVDINKPTVPRDVGDGSNTNLDLSFRTGDLKPVDIDELSVDNSTTETMVTMKSTTGLNDPLDRGPGFNGVERLDNANMDQMSSSTFHPLLAHTSPNILTLEPETTTSLESSSTQNEDQKNQSVTFNESAVAFDPNVATMANKNTSTVKGQDLATSADETLHNIGNEMERLPTKPSTVPPTWSLSADSFAVAEKTTESGSIKSNPEGSTMSLQTTSQPLEVIQTSSDYTNRAMDISNGDNPTDQTTLKDHSGIRLDQTVNTSHDLIVNPDPSESRSGQVTVSSRIPNDQSSGLQTIPNELMTETSSHVTELTNDAAEVVTESLGQGHMSRSHDNDTVTEDNSAERESGQDIDRDSSDLDSAGKVTKVTPQPKVTTANSLRVTTQLTYKPVVVSQSTLKPTTITKAVTTTKSVTRKPQKSDQSEVTRSSTTNGKPPSFAVTIPAPTSKRRRRPNQGNNRRPRVTTPSTNEAIPAFTYGSLWKYPTRLPRVSTTLPPSLPPQMVTSDPSDSGYFSNETVDHPGGLTTGEVTGIAVACIIVFWIILGPIVCLVCRMRDKAVQKRREREHEDSMSHTLIEEMIRMELARGRAKMYRTNVDDEREIERLPVTVGERCCQNYNCNHLTCNHDYQNGQAYHEYNGQPAMNEFDKDLFVNKTFVDSTERKSVRLSRDTNV